MKNTDCGWDEEPTNASDRKPKKIGRIILAIFLIILFLCAVAIGVFWLIFDSYYDMLNVPKSTPSSNTDGQNKPPATTTPDNTYEIPANKDVYNILLIGSDTRVSNAAGRSDAMILITINEHTERIVATSVMRDIYVDIPGRKSDKINTAFYVGGTELLESVLYESFGITVDWYASIDFMAFIDVVDAIGGVEIDVTKRELRFLNKNVVDLNNELGIKPSDDGVLGNYGLQTLTGKQALGYARIRKADSDFVRTSRQRTVLEQIFKKAKNASILELDRIANKVFPMVTTNISQLELLQMMLKLPAFLEYDFVQNRIPADKTWKYGKVDEKDVIFIDFEENRRILHDFMYGTAVASE